VLPTELSLGQFSLSEPVEGYWRVVFEVHDKAFLRSREGPEQAPVLFGVRNAEMGERLRRHGSAALLPLPAARLREHFVSHAYIVPHATGKTRPL
jgi:hypothetical protein